VEQAPGITRLLDRLEAKKLVSRERSSEDRRQVTCRLAEPGRSLLSRLDRVADESDDAMTGGLKPGELRQLIRLLDRMREGLSTPAG
jgi:MarR family multiple antibiotic resistance transcriptional regulator